MLCHIDFLVGKYIAACKQQGVHDSMVYCVTSSYGSVKADQHVNLQQELQLKLNMRIFNGKVVHRLTHDQPDGFRRYRRAEGVLCVNGGGFAHLYLRNPTTYEWTDNLDLDRLLSYPRHGRDQPDCT